MPEQTDPSAGAWTATGRCALQLWLVRARLVRPYLPGDLDLITLGGRWTLGGLFLAEYDPPAHEEKGSARAVGDCALLWGWVRYGSRRGLYLRRRMTGAAELLRAGRDTWGHDCMLGRIEQRGLRWRARAGRRWTVAASCIPLLPLGRRPWTVDFLCRLDGRIHCYSATLQGRRFAAAIHARSPVRELLPEWDSEHWDPPLHLPFGLALPAAQLTLATPTDIDKKGPTPFSAL